VNIPILRTLAIMLFCTGSLLGQDAVHFVANINQPHGGPGPTFGFYFASCWGYVAPDGHEYALIGCYAGTSIIDLDADPIAEVAYIPGANSEWKEMKTWGHYAYAVSENPTQGLQIIDLSQLPDTAWVVRAVFNVGGHNIANSHTISVADGYLYLNGGSSNGAVILDLADPENPTYAGQYQPEYLHDTYVKRDTLYGAAIFGGGVYIADVSNKAAPLQIGHMTYSGAGTHNTWKSDFGSFVFTTDEIGSTEHNMKVFDIAGLPSYTQLAPFTADPSSIIHNVHGRGNYVYIAHYTSGVFVADIHDPSNIVNAGTYDTYSGGGAIYRGCWGVYPYFPSGRWIASDTQTGLYVLTFDDLQPRTRSALLSPTDDDTLAAGSTVVFMWESAASQAEDPHYYQLHVWGSGLDTLVTTVDTSASLDLVSPFQEGETYSWNVLIRDEFTSVSSQDTFQITIEGGPTSVIEIDLPLNYALHQNHPNPFNPTTLISYQLREAGYVTLRVYDILGQEIATLVNRLETSGSKSVRWYGTNSSGRSVGSGVYLYRLTVSDPTGIVRYSDTRKMIMIR
jgi:choice-of-anchor B domain-containing protein